MSKQPNLCRDAINRVSTDAHSDEETLSLIQIAIMLNISKDSLYKIKADTKKTFPKPVGKSTRGFLYRKSDFANYPVHGLDTRLVKDFLTAPMMECN